MSGLLLASGSAAWGSVSRAAAWLRRYDGLALQLALVAVAVLLLDETLSAMAATDPWSKAASGLCNLFVDVIGPALAIVLVIVLGMTYASGEGASKSTVAYLVFGLGMVVLAPQFVTFFFGGTIAC